MLDPWIIEEIRRRERQDDNREQPVVELPLEDLPLEPEASPTEDDRGVFIIDT